ncbi:MAG: ABC transporter ATP-binding protein [Actinobacteria bacterium]|nr:ABC transporter ATP-binding protein [Actinomycetota bacterium]
MTAATPVVELAGVSRRYGNVVALDAVSLTVARGELLAVVGPSGCGKTTLLQVVAGLTAPDAGSVRIVDRVVVDGDVWVPPERRRVGVVFQDHALFPHLTVADNVAFGVPRGRGRAARRDEALDLVRLRHLVDRYPHELSGGEQQRVALARALAPAPEVVLLDEPFSSLDANLRTDLRQQTAAVLRAAGTTAIFVTHDQTEALSIGGRVAVLRAGRVEQCAEPETVFHAPTTRFAATFLGEADMVRGTARAGIADTPVGRLPVDDRLSGAVDVMVRPHEVAMVAAADGDARVERVEFRGATVLHVLALDAGLHLRCEIAHERQLPVGTRVRVTVDAGHPFAAFPTDPPVGVVIADATVSAT